MWLEGLVHGNIFVTDSVGFNSDDGFGDIPGASIRPNCFAFEDIAEITSSAACSVKVEERSRDQCAALTRGVALR